MPWDTSRRARAGPAERQLILPIDGLSLLETNREHVDCQNTGYQEERNQGLGQHHIKPSFTAPQNTKAKAATRNASFSKETYEPILFNMAFS
jgi:hypothetical protein